MPQRKRLRLEGYDYSCGGYYFVTIVTNHRHCLFGDVREEKMCLNEAGKAIDDAVCHIDGYGDGVSVPFHIVMPNHIHMVILQTGDINLSEILRRFKSETTHAYAEGVKCKGWKRFELKLWQRGYYEHIIRNQNAYDYIAQYILTNPRRWNKDAINPNHDDDTDNVMKHILELG